MKVKQNVDEPSLAAVEAHVRAILASEPFRPADRARRLLTFFLEQHISGAEPLKDFEIAERAFGRLPETSNADGLVRVQVHRLRQKLREFYESGVNADGFEVQVARGGYRLQVIVTAVNAQPVSEANVSDEIPILDLPPDRLSQVGLPATEPAAAPLPVPSGWAWGRIATLVVVGAVVAAASWIGFSGVHAPAPSKLVTITQTGRYAGLAKFSLDGKTIFFSERPIYGAPPELYQAPLDQLDSRKLLGYKGLRLYSVSPKGLMLLDADHDDKLMVARTPTEPAEVVDQGVREARWGEDGTKIVAVRLGANSATLEYPTGNVLLREATRFGIPFLHPAVSPNGRWIAYGRPQHLVDMELCVYDLQEGKVQVLIPNWVEFGPPAWIPGTNDLVIGGILRGEAPTIYRVPMPVPGSTTPAKRQALWQGTSYTLVEDVLKDGRMLVREAPMRNRTYLTSQKDGYTTPTEQSLSQGSHVVSISGDGSTLLLSESASKSKSGNETIYLWQPKSGQEPKQVGSGVHPMLHHDGKQMILIHTLENGESKLLHVDLRTMVQTDLTAPGRHYSMPRWTTDGKAIQFVDPDDSKGEGGLYVQPIGQGPGGGAPVHLAPLADQPVFVVGREILMRRGEELVVRKIGERTERKIGSGLLKGNPSPSFTAGKVLLVKQGHSPFYILQESEILELDLERGTARKLTHLRPGAGAVLRFPLPVLSADRSTLAYSTLEPRSTLYLLQLGPL